MKSIYYLVERYIIVTYPPSKDLYIAIDSAILSTIYISRKLSKLQTELTNFFQRERGREHVTLMNLPRT